ncbi:preprotein translocase subunit SecA [Nonomuraea sp. KM90]|uniref:preprotein translocase subunit SecA n=1 Tax=Nonomuraea sp. KM90 TaxID=3457428 RepID=UPI003FCEBD43
MAAGELVDDLLPEALAVACEAFWRVSRHRCSPDELWAGIALHGRCVLEIHDHAAAVAIAVYLGALEDRSVHVMTGDGAPRTTDVCSFLGLTVATLTQDLDDEERRAAYGADVTVGPPIQFGYDYLTDNRVSGPGGRVQRDLRRAIVTEADQVLLVSTQLTLLVNDKVVASIALAEYLRMYPHLAGVTATVATEAGRIAHGYGLPVEATTAQKRPDRRDHPDLIYATTDSKLQALVEATAGYHAAGRPVLIRVDAPSTVAHLRELLAAQGLTATSLHPERPLAHAGRPGAVTLLSEHVQDRQVILGGDLDWLAEEEVLASGLDPVATISATWVDALAAARRRLLPAWADDRQRVIDAGGLAVLGAECLESGWLEARTRELAGSRGDTRFFLSLDENWIPSRSRFNGVVKSSPDPITGWLATKALGRMKRRFHRNVVDLRCRGFDYASVGSAFRERFYAGRRRLIEGRDPLAVVIAMIGPRQATELEAMAVGPVGSAMREQVRSDARLIVDEEWARCLRDLRSLYNGYWDEGLPADSLAAYQQELEVRFEAMRRDVRERLLNHLLDLEAELPNRETIRRDWYYTREGGLEPGPPSANVDPRETLPSSVR